jgi:UDP-N-acetylmuramate dehydrogenase
MDVLHKVTYLDLETLDEVSLYNRDCMFSYRNSIFKKELKNKCFILSCVFELSRKISFNTKYSDIHNELVEQKINENDLNPRLFVNIIGQIRERKFPNLKKTGNAGSFFKNPLITSSQLKILLDSQCSSMPFYETDVDGIYKLSAGWLIDRAGWKGISMGSCGVYENHALVLVNKDFLANGQQILQLSKKIKKSVQSIFNIDLEEEVDIF